MTDENLTGYLVEAVDGSVGSVDRQSHVTGYDHLVVDTGVWVFGKSVVIPAGLVISIDRTAHVIRVGRTKEDIKQAPVFEHDQDTSSTCYLDTLDAYYSPAAAHA
ncbi:PRC-barrel domain containing protein [Streptomyces sp. NPDC058620]|uniref:PRC-barrel domain containing protein n=1 Tax=Streptomyces sp. NPDC058620 TaxID=3346560 RepID=UPI00364BD8ED